MNFVCLYLAVSAHKWLGTLFPVLHITYVIMLVWILTNYMLWCNCYLLECSVQQKQISFIAVLYFPYITLATLWRIKHTLSL